MAAQGCALSLWLWLSLLLPLLLGARAAAARWSGEGTTPHLQSIFLGRCAEYTTLLSLHPGNKNCTAIWEAFKVVLDKDPCSVLPSDYDLFINLSRHAIPRDKSLFWENNYLLVASFAENTRRLTPLCDVLYGKVGDFLSWCRQENASGLDYQSCPTSEDCENNAVDSYWKRASMQYSKDSSGVINVMLNGSEPKGAYPVKGESCGEGSVKILEDRLEALGFQHSCIDDYPPVKFLMCVDHTTHPDCVMNSASASLQRESPSFYTTGDASLVISLLVALTSTSQM
ncbi:ADP-ribosyl cyclase/cyclic ADP-ribose hydrolase 2 isoform X2 [Peromyscus californicus insignis]|uniref:ADP-ribosyl cyclase/cyclic ADP-ribose hydrolase 2 isoform X2 n=1 Tax=Peromyscus californicus insignis TaxID=564181 RepID=UPI0022A74F47|nr:ADP-ribosyl cyclase/cyclic ADP-ribose hydrolase 2 isoform X2 [Peromyscus californicus insignis]